MNELKETPAELRIPTEAPAGEDTPTHWPTALQFGLSALAVFGLWSQAALMAAAGLMGFLIPEPGDIDNLMLASAAAFLGGAFAALSALFSGARLLGRETPFKELWPKLRPFLHPRRLIWLLPFLLGIGYLISTFRPVSWLLLPPIHLLVTVLPLAWLVWLGIRGLPKGSAQREWGTFASGLVLGPMITFTLEIIALLVLLFAAIPYFSFNLELSILIESAALRLSSGAVPPEQMTRVVGDLINTPAVLVFFAFFIAVAVPLVEEIFKPIGVWLLAGRDLSPKEGMMLGFISGAGFALFENLVNVGTGQAWALLVLARITTSLMHILTAGLTGWALALAWRERRYWHLVRIYLLSVLIHAVWNGGVLASAYANALSTLTDLRNPPILPGWVQFVGPLLVLLMTAAGLYFLIAANRRMRADLVVQSAAGLEIETE